MGRRKSAVVSPAQAVSVLRRSARIQCREIRNGEGYLVSCSIPALSTMENKEPPRKSRRELGREVSKRLVYTFDGSVEVSSSKKSLRLNSSIDGFCSVRRSSRVINSGCSDAKEEKSSRCSSKNPASTSSCCLKSTIVSTESQGRSNSVGSCTLRRSPRFSSGGGSVSRSYFDGGNSGNSVLSRCNTKSILSERGKGENGMESRDRICRRSRSCIVQKTKQVLRACDKERVSVCLSKRKRMRIAKPHAEVNEAYNEEQNAGSPMIVESTAECVEEKREVVLGLFSTGFASFSDPVPKVDNVNKRGKELVDGREEEEPLMAKNNLVEEGKCGGDAKEWTKEQELTLQRAYLAANPSPHFWKKVSKMVPGKSAQECFDKMHTDLITPRQPKPRSRARKTNLSPIPQFSLSASKLLKPISPPKTKPRHRKNKLTKKTIRHLLEKQNHMDQSLGSDLFSILEPSNTLNILSTPTKKTSSLPKFVESSSSGQKGQCSRFASSNQTTLVSPPVLKQVKNKALHEKYIDHLHFREAKRRAESVRFAGKENIKPVDNIQKKDSVKDSLLFEVQDAIQKLRSLETENSSSSSEFCNDYSGESDEEEDGSI